MNIQMHKNFSLLKKQAGLTLVELLVASLLGLFLVGVVGTMYVASVGGFNSSNQLSKVQENTRFATHFIQQAIREAGYSTCGDQTRDLNFLNDAFNSTISGGVAGYEYVGTSFGDTYTLNYVDLDQDSTAAEITAAKTSNSGANAEWSGGGTLILSTSDDFITRFNPMKGSDIIAITYEEVQPSVIVLGSTNNRLTIQAGPDATLPRGAIVKVGDCLERNIFAKNNDGRNIRADNGPANIPNGSRPGVSVGSFSINPWPAGSTVYTDTTKIFYVGTGASGLPALFMIESICGFRTSVTDCGEAIAPVELVEGVENMQIMYGVDNNADGVANRYFTANSASVGDFSDVVTLKVSLLMRSNEKSETQTATNYTLSDGIIIDPIDKGVLRYVVNSTIELRNRGDE